MSSDLRLSHLTVRRDPLEDALANLLGHRLREPLQPDKAQNLASAFVHIARLILSICADLNSKTSTFTLPNISERMEELMPCALVTQLSHNYSHAICSTRSSRRRA